MEIHVGTDFYTLQYVNTSFNFTFVHLAGSVNFEDYFFKFEHIISGLIVSIGTRAQQTQVVICTRAQWVIRAQVTSCKRAQQVMRALVFIFIYSGSASSVNI